MRISGLNSGMETEQIIKDLMAVQRLPVDRVYQQKVLAEWKRDAYRDVNTKLSSFSNFVLDLRLQGTFTRNVATSSHEDILSVTATGAAHAGSYELKVNSLASSARFVSTEVSLGEDRPSEFKMRGLDGEMKEIKIDAEDTLSDIAAKINANKDLGISAFAHGDQISFTTKVTGADAKIVGDDNFKALFGGEGDELDEGIFEFASGEDAIVIINGLETTQASNTFDLNGITVNLLSITDENTVVRVDVEHDVDAVVDKIKEFVNLYNELVDELNLSIREGTPAKKGNYEKYLPLTPEQRAELSDKEIEDWEAKARTGLLRSDSILSGILSEMRMALGAAVQGEDGSRSLAQIGITTGSWYEYGRLNIDEDKLRAAVKEDPEGVMNLFNNSDDTNPAATGVARRLDTALKNGMDRLTRTAGKASISYDQSFFGERIREYESRLSIMEDRLIRYEQTQWAKFTAMERVLGQLYAQGDWLTQQIMGMQG